MVCQRCGSNSPTRLEDRIFLITGCSRIAAMIFSSPPQFGQCSRSRSNTRLSSRARTQTVQWTVCAWRGAGPLARRGLQGWPKLSRTGWWCAPFASHSAGFVSWAAASGPCGTTSARSLAEVVDEGASTPWKRIRCSLGLGTSDRRALFDRQRCQPLHELQRQHHQMRGAVAPGGLELEHHLSGGVGLDATVGQGQGRAGDGAALPPSNW